MPSKLNWKGVLAVRTAQEQAEYAAKLKERQEKEPERGRKPGGKLPKEPEPGPQAKDQANFTAAICPQHANREWL